MGVFRLFLAVLVALSHVGIDFLGYHIGVMAVISFYILSGYVMSMLIEKYYKKPPAIPTFYLDRIARLFPQYLFYMVLASVLIYFFGVDSAYIHGLTFAKWLLNFFILPQAFFMYWADHALVLPQTWSLGLEMTFYLVIPWMLVYFSSRQIYGIACASFLIFLTAYFGKINTDYFGYRLLLGTLFMFLVGWSFFKNDSNSRKFRTTILAAAALLLIAFLNPPLYQLPYNKEVLVGLVFGILAVSFLKHSRFSRLDEFFGNLSYGVFLNHLIINWSMYKFFGVTNWNAINIVTWLIISCALALVSYYFVEVPALRWRHAIRNGTIPNPAVNTNTSA